jgi:hypothetical protein
VALERWEEVVGVGVRLLGRGEGEGEEQKPLQEQVGVEGA